MDWNSVNCRTDCGLCNHRASPSNMKGSKDCHILRHEIPVVHTSIKDRVMALLSLKGIMRRMGKTKEEEKEEEKEE